MSATAKRQAYSAFINSPQWRAIRAGAIFAAGAQCENCGSRRRLEVHHLTYARFGGCELPSDLRVLCERCHQAEHESQAVGGRKGIATPRMAHPQPTTQAQRRA